LTAGCGSLVPGQGPPPDLYRLKPKPEFPADIPKVDWQLQVAAPLAPASLDSARIALLHNPLRMEYYARSNWVDRSPLMVQSAMVEAFETSECILSVTRDVTDARPDYILSTELRDFQAEYFLGPKPEVHAGILAKLVSVRRRSIVATKRFEGGGTAEADRIEDVVGAFSAALGKVLGDLVAWTLSSGEADRKTA
jgi:cholesterol transport system auxiliary component